MIRLIQRILCLSGKYRARIQTAFVFSFLKSMLSKMPICLAFLVLSGFYEQTLTPSHCLNTGIAMVVIVALEALCQFTSDRLQSGAGYMMFAEKRLELGAHLRRMPMGYFTSGNIGKVSSVLSTDMVFVEEVAMSTLANMMNYLFSSVIMAVFMVFLDWRLGIIAVGTSLAAVMLAGRMNRVSLSQSVIKQEQSEKLTDAVLSFIEGIGIIKSYNLLGEKSGELSGNFRRSMETSLGFEAALTPWHRRLNVLYALGMSAVFALAVYLQQTGALSLPYLCGVLLLVFDLFGPLKALYAEATRLTVMNSCLDRIEAVFDEPELPDAGMPGTGMPGTGMPGTGMPSTGMSGTGEDQSLPEVEFRDVSFAYEEKIVLSHVSFAVRPNTMTALVGPSGSGKSTIANLLARFWDVNSGTICFRGRDIREIPLAELMDQISIVFQRVYLFRDTVYNNISMGKPDASREEVYEAARKARCYEFIMALPEGFETVIGEGGATLSGGERQRISIARCILKDAPVVVLDEATASVDADNERYIQEAISELVKGKTLLVIAHRLNTIKAADNILVVSEGRIVQRGIHHDLMDQEGIYRDYVDIRERSAGWSLT
ncbi:ABC transporter ATP-binding protein [Enterocloster citroniae]|uniref:ABC transporter ATP-binding protein n=1 Tax=Enterocloster citroniae TaxID=358743 RepID=UPI00349EFE36